MAGIKRSSKEPAPDVWKCTKCGEVKPFTREFYKPASKWRAWGLSKECRACLNARELERRRNNPAAQETIKKWREKNIDAVRASARASAGRRYEKHKKYIAEWRKKNPHKASEYYQKVAESLKPKRRAWRQSNQEKMRNYTANYRAQKAAAVGRHGPEDIKRIGAKQKWRCAACRADVKDNYQVDHIYPVSKGGANDPSNLQLLCPRCNQRKAAKEPERFMRELGFLL